MLKRNRENGYSSERSLCSAMESASSKSYKKSLISGNFTTSPILPYCKSDSDQKTNAKFFQAVRKGKLNEVVNLLNSGVQINITDKQGKNNTALHSAIEECRTEIVELLLNRGSSITIKNCNDDSPLQLAMESGIEEIINNVIYRKINVPADGSCLFWATSLAYLTPVQHNNDHFQIRFEKLFGNEHSGDLTRNVQALLQSFNPSLENTSIFNNESLRRLVTEKLRNRVIDELLLQQNRFESSITVNDILYSKNEDYILCGTLQEKFCLEFVNDIPQNKINVATFKPPALNEVTIQLIDTELDKVPDQDRVKIFKFKAYLECMRKSEAWGGNHEIQAISHLLGCNINIFSGGLKHSISDDDVQESIQLFNNGESHYNFGLIRAPLLLEAVKSNNPQKAEAYLKSGIDEPNYEDAEGWTLLHYAAQRGLIDIVQSLLDVGANTTIKNFLNQTPLDVATFFKQDGAAAVIKRHLLQTGNSTNYSSIDQSYQLCQPDVMSSPAADSERLTFNRRMGTASISGHLYKIELLMHFLLQGINKYKTKEIDGFHLATNMEQTGEFNDVAFRYRDPGGKQKSKLIFLLARHRENAEKEKITIDMLFPKLERGDFDLKKCFKSYCKIKQQFSEVGHPIFETEFKDSDCDFVFYTNVFPDFTQDLNNFRKVSIVQKSIFYIPEIAESNHYYELSFSPNETQKIFDILQYTSDSKKLAKALAEPVLSFEVINVDKGVLQQYHIPLAEKVILIKGNTIGLFRKDFLNDEASDFRTAFFKELKKDESYAGKTVAELITSLESKKVILPDNFGKRKGRKGKYASSLPDDGICRCDVEELAEALAKPVLSFEVIDVDKGVLQQYHIPLAEKVIRIEGNTIGLFRKDFLNDEASDFRTAFFEELKQDESYAGKTVVELISSLEVKKVILPDSFGKSKARKGKYASSLPDDGICRSDVEEFLGKLKLFFGQPNVTDLCNKVIKKSMQSVFQVAEDDVDLVFSDVRNKVEQWWKDGSEYITESNTFFQESARISLQFDVRAPETLFTGRKKELADLRDALQRSKRKEGLNVISELIVVFGLGGTGKSELARKFIQDHAEDYDDNVIWINAESYSSMAESFRRLAHGKLGISPKALDGGQKDIKSIIEEVYRYFHKRKSLFIFDNAETYDTKEEKDEGIDKFLPSLSVNNEPHILITSRNSQWGSKVAKIALDVFSEEEAETFIKTYLGIKDDLQNNEVKDLAKILGYFPLALNQALAYILEARNSESEKGKFLISKYIEEYNTEELKVKNLLDFQILNDNEYTATTFITWKITLRKIKQMEYGEEALVIINMLAYFAPSNIHTRIFLIPIFGKRNLASSFQLLKQYSMISLIQGVANIHRLVQQVTRIRLKQEMREKEVLRNVLALLELPMQCDEPIENTYASHAACAWNYVNGYAELVEEFSELPGFVTARLLDGIRYEEAFIFVEKAVHLLSNTLGSLHPNTLTTQGNMALVLDRKGKFDEALSVYDTIVNKFKETLGTDHPHTLSTMLNRATILDYQGQYEEAELVYEEVFGHFKETLGDDHPDTLSVMSNLGGILYNLGKNKESLEIHQTVLNKRKCILGLDHPSTLKTLSNIASVLTKQGKNDTALEVHKVVLQKRKQTLGSDHPLTLDTMIDVAILLSDKGVSEEAIDMFDEVFRKRKQILGLDHPDTISAVHEKAILLGKKGDYDKALDIFEKVLEMRTQILGATHRSTLDTLHNMATAFDEKGNYAKALETNVEVLERRKQVLGSSHPDTLKTKCNLAGVLTTLGKYDESLKMFQELLNERTVSLGPNHPDTLGTKNGIAGILYKQGKFKESLKINLDVLETMKQTLSPQDPCMLSSLRNIALKLETLGEFDEALKTYQLVLEQGQQLFGYDHLETLNTKSDIGRIFEEQGKYEESLTIFEDVLDKRKQILGEDNPSTLYTMFNIASVLEKQHNYDKALKLYERVLKKFEEVLGPDHPNTLSSLHNMAVVFDSQGNLEDALRCYNLVIPKFQEICGPNHLSTLSALVNRAILFSKQGRYVDGEREFQTKLPPLKQLLGPKHPKVLTLMSNIANNLETQQKYNEALKVYEKLQKKSEEVFGPDHHDTLSTEHRISRVLFKKGSYWEALQASQEILNKRLRLFGNDHPYTLSTKKNIATILDKVNETALLRLISRNTPICDIIRLIETGANVNAQHDDSGKTPLFWATENNRIDVVDILLKNGSDASVVAKDGNTLIHIAVLKGYKDIAESLLKHMELIDSDKLSCFVNARITDKGATALHTAIAHGHWEIVELLLKYDADPTISDKDGKTAMDLAMERNHVEDINFFSQGVSRMSATE